MDFEGEKELAEVEVKRRAITKKAGRRRKAWEYEVRQQLGEELDALKWATFKGGSAPAGVLVSQQSASRG